MVEPRTGLPGFRQAHEIAERERIRRAKVRLGIVSFIAVLAVGWFAWDRPSYVLGVVTVVIVGVLADKLGGEK